jgi:signal recognition particle subunit SRP54
MGDVVSLVERAQEAYSDEEAKKLEAKLRKNQFDFNDFFEQIQQIKKMGNIKDLMGMIPGVGKAMKDLPVDNDAFKSVEAIIQSMTPEERRKPEILSGSRRKRIAKGSGYDIQRVNQLIKQFEDMQKMMKMMNKMGKGGKGMKMPFGF